MVTKKTLNFTPQEKHSTVSSFAREQERSLRELHTHLDEISRADITDQKESTRTQLSLVLAAKHIPEGKKSLTAEEAKNTLIPSLEKDIEDTKKVAHLAHDYSVHTMPQHILGWYNPQTNKKALSHSGLSDLDQVRRTIHHENEHQNYFNARSQFPNSLPYIEDVELIEALNCLYCQWKYGDPIPQGPYEQYVARLKRWMIHCNASIDEICHRISVGDDTGIQRALRYDKSSKSA